MQSIFYVILSCTLTLAIARPNIPAGQHPPGRSSRTPPRVPSLSEIPPPQVPSLSEITQTRSRGRGSSPPAVESAPAPAAKKSRRPSAKVFDSGDDADEKARKRRAHRNEQSRKYYHQRATPEQKAKWIATQNERKREKRRKINAEREAAKSKEGQGERTANAGGSPRAGGSGGSAAATAGGRSRTPLDVPALNSRLPAPVPALPRTHSIEKIWNAFQEDKL